jgi:ADP-heptose:LPS heptosyltransferase
MISFVIPAAGLFRYNEPLWALIAAAKPSFAFEVVIPTTAPVSPRLVARLAQLGITYKLVVLEDPGAGVGMLFDRGTRMAIGDICIWLHDDALPKTDLRTFARAIADFRPGEGLRVPIVAGAINIDQHEFKEGQITTRFIDRCSLAFRRAEFLDLGITTEKFSIDGYQIALQSAFANAGQAVGIAGVSVDHEGGATLINVQDRDYGSLFESDTREISRILGTWVEHGARPAVPRIIPAGREHLEDLLFCEDPLRTINENRNTEFTYRGVKYGRITMGNQFAIPPLIDVYDVALVAATGIGDAIMHTSAVHHFKELYPDVRFRLFTYGNVADLSRRFDVWDQVIKLAPGEGLPPSARVWNVANGIEGTPIFGFKDLGINGMIPKHERRTSRYVRHGGQAPDFPAGRPLVGIQLNGGWKHKRYAHPEALADALYAQGFYPMFFGTLEIRIDSEFPRIHTKDLDTFAACLEQLSAWVGFDSGASYLANSLGIPSVLMFASHNPGGLIEACGAAGPYQTIFPAKQGQCAMIHGKSCRPGLGGAFFGWGTCGLKEPEAGAVCLDEIPPEFLAQEVVNLLATAATK